MPVIVTTDVYRRNIASQFLRGGQGYRWLDSVKLAMFRACVANAPSRTNELRASHRSSIRGINQYAARAVISNIADHAEYVHEGRPSIRASGGGRLILPAGGPGVASKSPYAGQTFGRKALKRVGPQAPNPWLDEACARIARQRGAIQISR